MKKIYTCKTCHQNLRTRTGGEPKIPKVLVPKQHSAAQKFLTAIQQKPEFVCTCCHRWLFRKSVSIFDEKRFDFGNDIVACALSQKHRFTQHDKDTDEVRGYICVRCK